MEGVDAVIFDCDGVLVDSEPVSEWAWRAALGEHSIDIGPDFSPWIGTTDQAIADEFADEAGVPAAHLSDRAEVFFRERLEEVGLTAFEDTSAAIGRAEAAGLGMAIATNSQRWRLEAILAATHLDGVFGLRVTADDVVSPKPAPDIYLRAVELLGMETHRGLVIEDSPTGITAARAAGLRVIAVDRGIFDSEELAPATRVVTSLSETAPA